MIRAIALTAHHDDALLWCGGTIRRTRALGWNWTIVAMCVPDMERQRYLEDYCRAAGASLHHFAFNDYLAGEPFSINNRDEFLAVLKPIVVDNSYDFVVTHSRDVGGEYGGHANHEEVREAVSSLVPPDQLVYFCYGREIGLNGKAPTARIDADYHVQLHYDEIVEKALWCQRAPDAKTNLRWLGYPCPNPEGFRTGKILGSPFIPQNH